MPTLSRRDLVAVRSVAADIDMVPIRDLAHVWGPAYLGGGDPADPFVSPALADLSGLPPRIGRSTVRSGG